MAAYMNGRMGDTVDDVSAESIREVLVQLDEPPDDEHPDVSICHTSGWTLSAFQSGRLIWENDEDGGGLFHMAQASRRTISRLFTAIASDDLTSVHDQPWLTGYQ
jgi:hypothetical protein